MIIWQGKGWMVIAILIGCSLVANVLTDSLSGSDQYWEQNKWPLGLALVASGIICWFVGAKLELEGVRTLIDPETDELVVIYPQHTLFWIPVKYCGVIALLGGILVTVLDIVNAG